MTRCVLFALICVLVIIGGAMPTVADDPPKRITVDERKELETQWEEVTTAGVKAYQSGKGAEALKAFEEGLAVARKLYNAADFPDGHANLAKSLNNLAVLYQDQGKADKAEPLFTDALAIYKRLFPGDHPDVATSLNNLAALYQDQGKLDKAEPMYTDALAMYKRLFKGDHPSVAMSLNSLAVLYQAQGKADKAEPLFSDALAMYKRLFPGDHPDVATSLNNLAVLYEAQGKADKAEPLFTDALAMYKRLFKGDHPDVARGLNNLAYLYSAQGKADKAEPLFTDALAMYKRLFKGDHPDVARGLNNLAYLYSAQGKADKAEPLSTDALAMYKRLFKGDHPDVARGLNNLAALYKAQGKADKAEPLFTDALDMRKRLFKGDHPSVAMSLNSLAALYQAQGKADKAEPLFTDALAMQKRLFKGDHPDVATSLNSLAALYQAQGKADKAEPLFTDALTMQKRLFKGDHPDVARGLNNLAYLYSAHGKADKAEPMFTDALAIYKRLFPGDHPDVATSLNNLAALYQDQGKLDKAEPMYTDALAMYKRLFKGDHPSVATSLHNLAALYRAQGKADKAEPLFTDALAMTKRLLVGYAAGRSEGDALNFTKTQGLTRDGLLSLARQRAAREPAFDPGTAYPAVWGTKGTLARVFERRQLQTRAAATDPALARQLDQLADARRTRGQLLLAPKSADPGTQKARDAELAALDQRIADLTRQTAAAFAPVARADKLDAATVAELQKALPAEAVLADYTRYTLFGWDDTQPVGKKQTRTQRYVAFVVTKDAVVWVDLKEAKPIEEAIQLWRDAITGSGKAVPADIPKKVRELVWEKVRKEIPAGVKTVYVSPDADLTRVPWAAIPGDKPGTILLEDYAVVTIPHATFLLDKLWPQDSLKNPPTGSLVVGGVKYDAEPLSHTPNITASRGDPLLKPGEKLGWSYLPGTASEASGVFEFAERKKHPPTQLEGDAATTTAVLAALPKAKYAHFATHGFFADPSFRSAFQLDPKDYEKSLRGERIGRAVNSPMVMTGLVLAGANNPKTPGRGIITGEALIDLDLSGLELAVLSACETGLGDVAGGEGTFGLQRAFHLAGARNVVASLWKVDDDATAALMNLFYQNLWEKNLTTAESLRQAQLEIYRHPQRVPELAKGLRREFKVVPGKTGNDIAPKPGPDGKAHPRLWAAFTLSGPGN